MVRDGVDPFVEGGVEFSDDMLLPLLPHEAKERLRFVDRVLYDKAGTRAPAGATRQLSATALAATRKQRVLTIVRSANARIWCRRM